MGNHTKHALPPNQEKAKFSPHSLKPYNNSDPDFQCGQKKISSVLRPWILADSIFYSIPAESVNHCRSGDSCPFVKVSLANL